MIAWKQRRRPPRVSSTPIGHAAGFRLETQPYGTSTNCFSFIGTETTAICRTTRSVMRFSTNASSTHRSSTVPDSVSRLSLALPQNAVTCCTSSAAFATGRCTPPRSQMHRNAKSAPVLRDFLPQSYGTIQLRRASESRLISATPPSKMSTGPPRSHPCSITTRRAASTTFLFERLLPGWFTVCFQLLPLVRSALEAHPSCLAPQALQHVFREHQCL